MGFTFPANSTCSAASLFMQSIWNWPNGKQREEAIFGQYAAGNIPTWMQKPLSVKLVFGNLVGWLEYLPDYLTVGSDDDFCRTPMNPLTAQRIADLYNAVLPTTLIVEKIWSQATIRIQPAPIGAPYDASMMSIRRFVLHNDMINKQITEKWPLFAMSGSIAGHKKDVVISKALDRRRESVAIFGWHRSSGIPIQHLTAYAHENTYADYSHGIRLVGKTMTVNGKTMLTSDVLADPLLCGLISNEGPHTIWRQPGT